MLLPLLDKARLSDSGTLLWALLGMVVAAQIVAMWMLCKQQVDRAQAREAALRAERVALRDNCAPRDGRATCLPAPAQR